MLVNISDTGMSPNNTLSSMATANIPCNMIIEHLKAHDSKTLSTHMDFANSCVFIHTDGRQHDNRTNTRVVFRRDGKARPWKVLSV